VYDWSQIVEEHGPAAYRIARRILGQAADAEDVCQDVFFELHRLSKEKSIRNWPGLVRRLSTLRSLDRLRGRRPLAALDDISTATERDNPQAGAMANELVACVHAGLASLPQQQAAAFALRYFEQMGNQEIADCLETTPSAISTALNKARDSLNHLLKEQLPSR